jgi:hypothetical protein
MLCALVLGLKCVSNGARNNVAQIHYHVFDHQTHKIDIQSTPWNPHHMGHN